MTMAWHPGFLVSQAQETPQLIDQAAPRCFEEAKVIGTADPDHCATNGPSIFFPCVLLPAALFCILSSSLLACRFPHKKTIFSSEMHGKLPIDS